jgi:hypothetical protein
LPDFGQSQKDFRGNWKILSKQDIRAAGLFALPLKSMFQLSVIHKNKIWLIMVTYWSPKFSKKN